MQLNIHRHVLWHTVYTVHLIYLIFVRSFAMLYCYCTKMIRCHEEMHCYDSAAEVGRFHGDGHLWTEQSTALCRRWRQDALVTVSDALRRPADDYSSIGGMLSTAVGLHSQKSWNNGKTGVVLVILKTRAWRSTYKERAHHRSKQKI